MPQHARTGPARSRPYGHPTLQQPARLPRDAPWAPPRGAWAPPEGCPRRLDAEESRGCGARSAACPKVADPTTVDPAGAPTLTLPDPNPNPNPDPNPNPNPSRHRRHRGSTRRGSSACRSAWPRCASTPLLDTTLTLTLPLTPTPTRTPTRTPIPTPTLTLTLILTLTRCVYALLDTARAPRRA